ncbi:MAG: ATPase, T2SS/T4P/T4SS family [Candidatus Omnitrophota bacterium]|nr:ATPase, T2SS/T4P/T4SS family [Candidatus Omnitrophota bacterium]
MARLIGERLVEKGLLTPAQLKKVLEKLKTDPRRIGEILVADGLLAEPQVMEALSEQLKIPFVDVEYYKIDKGVIGLFPKKFLYENQAVPLFRMQNTVTVALADPLNLRTIDRLRSFCKCDVQPLLAAPTAIAKLLDRFYGPVDSLEEVLHDSGNELGDLLSPGGERSPSEDAKGLAAVAERAPIVKLVDTILKQAVAGRASDIHLEPEEKVTRLRYRIDGVLYEVPASPKQLEAAVISRFKIMSGLDIAERRLPQDGRFQLKLGDREVDFRISTFPTIYGENVAIRVLDKSAISFSLDQLGFPPALLEKFKALIQRPHGIVLVTGPTGSGKTSTLYAGLRVLDSVKYNVITLEDPVEYRIPGIRQSQIDVKAGLNFSSGLRSIVRQDPDVIMIGEIRDFETAEIAIHAALTGHLVFSTLHTNDAPGAITRLIDMGVEPFLVSSALIGVLAQRLVRTLCVRCKQPGTATPEVLASLGVKEMPAGASIFRIKGCEECKQSGYRGRTGIFELLEVSDALRDKTIAKGSSSDLRAQAIRDGMQTLRQSGVAKVLSGLTTVEEILRVAEYELSV